MFGKDGNWKYFAYIIPFLLVFGCIQTTPPPPPVGEKIKIEFGGPQNVKIGGSSSFYLRVSNNLSKSLENLRASFYSPDTPVSIAEKVISLGDVESESSAEKNVSFSLGSNAINGLSYSIEGRVCFDYEQEGIRTLAFAKGLTSYNLTEQVEEGPLSISFKEIPTVLTLAPVMELRIKVRNEMNGDVTTKNINATPNSAIRGVEISLEKGDWMKNVVTKISWVEKNISNAIQSDSYLTWKFGESESFLVMQMRDGEKEIVIDIYADLDEAYSELESSDVLLSELQVKLDYTYCIELPTYTFQAVSY